MQDSDGSKNFLGKNFKNFADGATIFDFTYYRIDRMLKEMVAWDDSHPDILVLNNILELYIDGDIDVYWTEGLPMAYPKQADHAEIDFSHHGVGIFDDSLFDACTDEEYESALEEWEGEIPDREDF